MKKRLNRLKFAVITVYFLILLLLIVGILLSPNPRYSFWSLATAFWVIPGCMLPYGAYVYLFRILIGAEKTKNEPEKSEFIKGEPEKTECLKKRFNWIKPIVIIIYLLILLLLIVGILLSPNPRYSFWSLATAFWVIPGCMLPYAAYIFLLRATLPPTKEHAVVLLKTSEDDELFQDGYSITTKEPVIVFRLDSGRQMKSRVSHRLYEALRVGDTGTLILKKNKKDTYFIDFVRD